MTTASVQPEPEAPVPSKQPQAVPPTPIITEGEKIDEITAIQDSIDGLSLAMFEALRGLRDAVAPESGNLTAEPTDNSGPDFEEFWQSYRNNDPDVVAEVRRVVGAAMASPQTPQDCVRIFAKVEKGKDRELVAKLAATVLQKSSDIDERVTSLSGMDRTRTQQMSRIEELLIQNQAASDEIVKYHDLATKLRAKIRKSLQEKTCEALGIEEFKY